MLYPNLNSAEIEKISDIFGDTNDGLSGHEIRRILDVCSIPIDDSNSTKRYLLFNSLACKCNNDRDSSCVYKFIKEAFEISRWLDRNSLKEQLRVKINEVLSLKGIKITDTNEFEQISIARTVSEAKLRAAEFKTIFTNRKAHNEVIKCCKEEFFAEDYFHAVHEASKSLTDRISNETGVKLDGQNLIECVFSSNNPLMVLNNLQTKSEINEHNGLKYLLIGVNSLVRNVTAHEMRIKRDIDKDQAIDILHIISTLHKMLDKCHIIKRQE